MRFTGTIEAKADAKGRVFFPAMFRKVLASAGEEQLVLSRDAFQPCLVLYPRSVWDEQLDSLRAGLSRWNARQQMIMREFVCDVETVTLDGGGRFLIPEIKQDVVFLGMDDTVEIWSPRLLEEQRMPAEEFAKELENLMNAPQ